MYNTKGELVWHATLDVYGRITVKKGDKYDCPFRYQGQYADKETGGLYYNRFRYYDPNTGLYISQDPIGLAGGMALYGYVGDVNGWLDVFGLSGIISSENFRSIDLTDPNWRNISFNGSQSGLVYVLKDTDTRELLKVGKSEITTFKGRFEKYATAGKKAGINLTLDIFTIDKSTLNSIESVEKAIRNGLEKVGYSLPWDNTNNRLGRPGPGTPFTRLNKKLRITHEWDSKGNLKRKGHH